ncbi:MAG: hypothetical protein CL902_00590 [Dehalococcoidia bacterium]|nr:hypothetical protein [Dehalococcoidia bacterium]
MSRRRKRQEHQSKCTTSAPTSEPTTLVHDIASVQFSLLSSEEARRMSVVEVTKTALMERNAPRIGGVNDTRLGTIHHATCGTCRNPLHSCPGHFGHIELAEPVFHPLHVDTALKLLRTVCFWCSACHTDIAKVSRAGGNTLTLAAAAGKNIAKCGACGGAVPSYSRVGIVITATFSPTELEEMPEGERVIASAPFTAARARLILKFIPDRTLLELGMRPSHSRPEDMILEVIPVPPTCVRPSVGVDNGSRSRGHDDLTLKLQDILKVNHNIRQAATPDAKARLSDLLQVHVCLYYDKDARPAGLQKIRNDPSLASSMLPRTTACKSLTQRLKGKRGRVRGNLMGKRTNSAARTVITPDAEMDMDMLGVPRYIMRHQTIPETVTSFNIRELKCRIQNGPDNDRGAHSVQNGSDRDATTSLWPLSDELRHDVASRLRVGDIVHRNLKPMDIVIFNRQPSLHRESMMGHRAVPVEGMTFQLSVPCTTPYNADFDGDEMNLHVPQSYAARAEVASLMMVTNRILSAQSGKPCMGSVQDTVVGSYLLTRQDVFFDRATFFQLSMAIHYPKKNACDVIPAILKPQVLYSGMQLFSCMLSADLNLTRSRGDCDTSDGLLDTESTIRITKGIMHSGRACKNAVGTSRNGIIHRICLDISNEVARQFISDNQRLVAAYLCKRGFSVGIGDCMVPANALNAITTTIDRVEAHYGIAMGATRHSSLTDSDEEAILDYTTRAFSEVGRIVGGSMSKNNAIDDMWSSGSKGSSLNLTQIVGLVGQTTVSGGRVHPSHKGGRTLPSFPADSTAMLASGWCRNSYMKGLTPGEFFQHAKGGREGLVDTSVKTAYTGYIQRRLSKLMEAVLVLYDGTVRTSHGKHVISFHHGGNGLSSQYLESSNISDIVVPEKEMRERYVHEEFEEIAVRLRTQQRYLQRHSVGFDAHSDTVVTPLNQNITRRIISTKRGASAKRLSAASCVSELDGFMRRLCEALRTTRKATLGIEFILVAAIGTCPVLYAENLAAVFEDANRRCIRSIVPAGEPVGAVAATSVGEPCTQMTLNTFHTAGVRKEGSISNMEQGVGQFKSLIDVSTVGFDAPVLLFLHPYLSHSSYLAQRVCNSIVRTRICDIVAEPPEVIRANTRDTRDLWIRRLCAVFPNDPDDIDPARIHAPVPDLVAENTIRVVLDRTKCDAADITIDVVADAVRDTLSNTDFEVMQSEACMKTWVIRVVVTNLNTMITRGGAEIDENHAAYALHVSDTLRALQTHLMEVIVKGVGSVKSAHVVKVRNRFIISTEGGDATQMMALDCIDPLRSHSWDPSAVAKTLGIVAARAVLRFRICKVLKDSGANVNWRHPDLLVRCMTYRGILVPVSRHGMARSDHYPPLMRASFEEPVDVFRRAAVDAKVDFCDGVSPAIMLGRAPPLGTGIVHLVHAPKATAFLGKRRKVEKETPEEARAKVLWNYQKDPDTILDELLASETQEKSREAREARETPPARDHANTVRTPDSPRHVPESPPYVPESPPYVPGSPPYAPPSPLSLTRAEHPTSAKPGFVPRSPVRITFPPYQFRPRSPRRLPNVTV